MHNLVCSPGSGLIGRRIKRKVSEEQDPEPGLRVTGSKDSGLFRQERE